MRETRFLSAIDLLQGGTVAPREDGGAMARIFERVDAMITPSLSSPMVVAATAQARPRGGVATGHGREIPGPLIRATTFRVGLPRPAVMGVGSLRRQCLDGAPDPLGHVQPRLVTVRPARHGLRAGGAREERA